MPESYEAKKNRWLKIRGEFPSALQNIPFRSAYAVATLSKEQQQVLADAITKSKITLDINIAVEILIAQPGIDSDELILAMDERSSMGERSSMTITIQLSLDDLSALADALQIFYPQMPRGTADALAEHDPAMQATLAVVASARAALQNAKSDFVVFSLYGVLKKYSDELASTIQNTPSLLQAIRKTGIAWED